MMLGFLWTVGGKEVIEIDHVHILRRVSAFGIGRRQSWPLAEITRLVVRNPPNMNATKRDPDAIWLDVGDEYIVVKAGKVELDRIGRVGSKDAARDLLRSLAAVNKLVASRCEPSVRAE